jgi:hypothetical protein
MEATMEGQIEVAERHAIEERWNEEVRCALEAVTSGDLVATPKNEPKEPDNQWKAAAFVRWHEPRNSLGRLPQIRS